MTVSALPEPSKHSVGRLPIFGVRRSEQQPGTKEIHRAVGSLEISFFVFAPPGSHPLPEGKQGPSLVFLLLPSHPSPSCLCWGAEVNHSPAVLPGASTRGLPRSFRASAVTFRGCCDVKNFIPLPTCNGCQGQRAETVFHGLGVYFGACPGGWEESCPWVMLGIFKYTGPEIQCPGAPRLNQHGSLRAAVGCISWLGARITYGVFSAGRVCGGGWRWGEHICCADASCKVIQK